MRDNTSQAAQAGRLFQLVVHPMQDLFPFLFIVLLLLLLLLLLCLSAFMYVSLCISLYSIYKVYFWKFLTLVAVIVGDHFYYCERELNQRVLSFGLWANLMARIPDRAETPCSRVCVVQQADVAPLLSSISSASVRDRGCFSSDPTRLSLLSSF